MKTLVHMVVPIVVAALCVGGCSTQRVSADKARAMSAPGIGPDQFVTMPRTDQIVSGDQIQVTVLGYPEFNATSEVKETGTITVPLVGEVKAMGLTREQLTDTLVAKLSDYVKTRVYVTVAVTTGAIQKIIILGAVGAQGSYPITGPVSIFQLLANAGGLAADADLAHVRIYRNSDLARLAEYDLSGFVTAGPQNDYPTPIVNPGDLVYVARSENFFRAFSPFVYDILVLLTLFALVS